MITGTHTYTHTHIYILNLRPKYSLLYMPRYVPFCCFLHFWSFKFSSGINYLQPVTFHIEQVYWKNFLIVSCHLRISLSSSSFLNNMLKDIKVRFDSSFLSEFYLYCPNVFSFCDFCWEIQYHFNYSLPVCIVLLKCFTLVAIKFLYLLCSTVSL